MTQRKNGFVDFKAVKSAVHMEQVLEHYGVLESMSRSELFNNRSSSPPLLSRPVKLPGRKI